MAPVAASVLVRASMEDDGRPRDAAMAIRGGGEERGRKLNLASDSTQGKAVQIPLKAVQLFSF